MLYVARVSNADGNPVKTWNFNVFFSDFRKYCKTYIMLLYINIKVFVVFISVPSLAAQYSRYFHVANNLQLTGCWCTAGCWSLQLTGCWCAAGCWSLQLTGCWCTAGCWSLQLTGCWCTAGCWSLQLTCCWCTAGCWSLQLTGCLCTAGCWSLQLTGVDVWFGALWDSLPHSS